MTPVARMTAEDRREAVILAASEAFAAGGYEATSTEEIARQVDSIGGNMDAFTAKECICFNVKVLDENVPTALDILSDLVLNAVNDATVAAPDHRWVKDLPDEPVWVRGDHARLHQLVSNLLSNACVHTPPGVTVTTGITCRRDGPGAPYAELTVTDDGPGIDAELLPKLFERFVRADKSRSNGSGNGLGLAIVSSIVKAHQGSVTAESADGRTIFRVRLPLVD